MTRSVLRDVPGQAVDDTMRSWRIAGAALSASVLVILTAYAETAGSIVTAWASSNLYSHGFLVIPAVAFLLWRRRGALADATPTPFALGLLALVSACLVWLLGETTTTSVFKHLGLILMIQAATLTLLGWRLFWAMRFPLAYLFFAVPFGAGLIPPLQDATAEIVTAWLQAGGIPAHLTGHRIVTPAGAFHIAEACAGVRFLMSAFAVGVFASDLFYRQIWRKLLLVGASLAMPIVANALRAYGIIVIAVHFGRESGVVVDHVTYGLLFLSVVLLALLGLGLIFRESVPLQMPPSGRPVAGAVPGSGRTLFALLAVALIVAVGPAVLIGGRNLDQRAATARPTSLKLDPAAPWHPAVDQAADWRPTVQNADFELTQSFVSGDEKIAVYIAYFLSQRQGAEVVNEENRVAGNLSSQVAEILSDSLQIDGHPTEVPCMRVAEATSPLWICYWYWVDERFTGSPVMAKLYQATARLWGTQSAAAIVAVATPDRAAPGDARQVMQRFLQDVTPLNTALQEATSD